MLDVAAWAVPFDKRDKTQRAYWLAKCRALMSGVRDENGRRMVFNIPKKHSVNKQSEYVLVAACTDPDELAAIRYRLRGDISGLENSVKIIDEQIGETERIKKSLDRAIMKVWRDEDDI